jgi:CheY-like chemotaxis protein
MHIIVCSDNKAVRRSVAEQTAEPEARLTLCDSGMELLAAVRTLHADLVIMDLGMHGLGGLLLASAVEELAPGLPILAVSAARDVDARAVIQKGIPHVVLDAGKNEGDLRALVAQLTGRRDAALGVGLR